MLHDDTALSAPLNRSDWYDRAILSYQSEAFFKQVLLFKVTVGKKLMDLNVAEAAALQWAMRSLDWDEKGIRVDGRFLSNLRFADNIVLFSKNTNQAVS